MNATQTFAAAAALSAALASGIAGDAVAAPKRLQATTAPNPVTQQVANPDYTNLIWALSSYNKDVYGRFLPRLMANLNTASPKERAEINGMLQKFTVAGNRIAGPRTLETQAYAYPPAVKIDANGRRVITPPALYVSTGGKTLLISDGQITLWNRVVAPAYTNSGYSSGDLLLMDGVRLEVTQTTSSMNNKPSFFDSPGTAIIDPIQFYRNTPQDKRRTFDWSPVRLTPLDMAFLSLAKRDPSINDDQFASNRQAMTEKRDTSIPGVTHAKIDPGDSPSLIVKDLQKIWPVLSLYEKHILVAHIIASDKKAPAKIEDSTAFTIFSKELNTKFSPSFLKYTVDNLKRRRGADFDRTAYALKFEKAHAFVNFENISFLKNWKIAGPIDNKTVIAGAAGFQELVAAAAGLDQKYGGGVKGEVAKRLFAWIALDGQDQTYLGAKVARTLLGALMTDQKQKEYQVSGDINAITVIDRPVTAEKPVSLAQGAFETAYAIYLFEQSRGKDGKEIAGPVDYAQAISLTKDLMEKMDKEGVFTQRLASDVAVSYHLQDLMKGFRSTGLQSVFRENDASYLQKTADFLKFAYDNATYENEKGEKQKIPLFGFMANMFGAALQQEDFGKGPYAVNIKNMFGIDKLDGKITNEEQQLKTIGPSLEQIAKAMSNLKLAAPGQDAAIGHLQNILIKGLWANKGTAPHKSIFATPVLQNP